MECDILRNSEEGLHLRDPIPCYVLEAFEAAWSFE